MTGSCREIWREPKSAEEETAEEGRRATAMEAFCAGNAVSSQERSHENLNDR